MQAMFFFTLQLFPSLTKISPSLIRATVTELALSALLGLTVYQKVH